MTEADKNDPLIRPGLEKLLIDNKVISRAQADVALADQEMTGMSFEEVLLIRGWVDKETLYKLAPWLSETNLAERKAAEKTSKKAAEKVIEKAKVAEKAPAQSISAQPAKTVEKKAELDQANQANYQENLKTYRQLMEKILGKSRSN